MLTILQAILAPIKHIPTVETLHALMLLSWAEHQYGRIMEFRMYSQVSVNRGSISVSSV